MSSSDSTKPSMPDPGPAFDATRTALTKEGTNDAVPEQSSFVAPPGFVLEKVLGRGGMGIVFLARQIGLNRFAALKMLLLGGENDPKHVVRFLAEAEAVAAIHHTNVIQVYEFGGVGGRPFLAMEYLAHGTLTDRIRRGPMSPTEAATLVAKLADAVQAAHEMGIVHRDVKPSNVLFDEHDEPKLTDFGLAKRGLGADLTQTQAVMGTPAYMAPEQAAGRTKFVGPAADIYALGVILYECLCGKRPFDHPDTLVLLRQVAEDDAPSIRREHGAVPRDLDLVCNQCLAKDPARRYSSAGALAADLRRFLSGEPVSARPMHALASLGRWMRKHPTTAATSGVAIAMLVVLAIGAWIANGRLRNALADANAGWAAAETHANEVEREKIVSEAQRVLAEKRREEAERNEAEAKRLRGEVEAQRVVETETLRNRLDLLDDLIFNFDGRLANFSGAGSIRIEFLEEVKKYSERLLKEKPDDPSVLRQVARVYRSIGDLYDSRSEYRMAEASYNRTISIYRDLWKKFPDRPEYFQELTMAIYLNAFSIANTKPITAARDYAEAGAMFDQLATKDVPKAAQRAARCAYRRANAMEEMEDRKGSLPVYRDAIARQKKLLESRPQDHDLWNDLGLTCLSMAMAIEPDDAAAALEFFRESLVAARQALALSPQSTRYKREKRYAYAELAAFCVRQKRDGDFAAMAREYLADHPTTDANGAYNAACFLANASQLARSAGRAERADAHAKTAVELLNEAVERGFADGVHLRTDFDLDHLRERNDFKAFLVSFDKRFPARSYSASALIKNYKDMFDGMAERADSLVDRTSTVAERKRAERERPDFDLFARKILAIADGSPGEAGSLDGLVWIVKTAPTVDADSAAKHRATALAKLEAYVTKPEFANACPTLSRTPTPVGDKLLKAASMQGKDAELRGLAALALAYSLASQAEKAAPGTPAQAEMSKAAEEQLERTMKEHANIAYQESTIGELAKAKLHAVRTLSIGRAAREITGDDLDGKPLKLSETRGKVCLLFFWANWCGYCRQMYPHACELVQNYSGRPFVLLGVNADEESASARKAVEKEKLNWRSFNDSGTSAGRIREEWQVESFPRVFLIDHNGIIRERWAGKPDMTKLEAVVARYVREAEMAIR